MDAIAPLDRKSGEEAAETEMTEAPKFAYKPPLTITVEDA